jgi:arsenite-transporting ATPase
MKFSDFIESAPRVLFFTGKGGVGKTSLSCAAAISLADRGRKVLLVSTDPASNLDEVLNAHLTGEPAAIPDAVGLFALNIDPQAEASEWRERVVAPYRGVLPAATLASMEEQLSGACTVEIAAFDRFTKLLGDPRTTTNFDHLIFDTAPTGHTIRLLNLPAAWTGFIAGNTTGTSCLGPLAGLESQKHLYQSALAALSNAETTTLVLVSKPEKSALAEAERTSEELAAIGMRSQFLLINGVFDATDRADVPAAALQAKCERALAGIPAGLSTLPRVDIPLRPKPPMGVDGLRRLAGDKSFIGAGPPAQPVRSWPSLNQLVQNLLDGGPGVILTMGKGGVGKTTIASSIAVALAAAGRTVHLTTTDPAAHIAATIDGSVSGVRVSRIDPTLETEKYTAEVLAEAIPSLDPQGIALLEEDLRSPCTAEIAVFRAFADTVASRDADYVVLDTAPTGHTLLLLDAAEAYHREVTRKLSAIPDAIRELLPRLRDPQATRVLLVTQPEATPVHEAARLQDDLARAGISTFAWVVNQSLELTASSDPLLRHKAASEAPFLDEVAAKLATRVAVVPWVSAEPVGIARLRDLAAEPELARL